MRWPPMLMVLAAGIMFILFAVLEVRASRVIPQTAANPATPWTVHIQQVDEALAEQNISAAEQAWHEAYAAALGSRRWEGLVEVGDASLRIGDVAKGRTAAEATARRLYLAALFRARNEGSLDGVIRTAEAFAALGDREVVSQGIRIAEQLAAQTHDAQALDRVLAFKERLVREPLL